MFCTWIYNLKKWTWSFLVINFFLVFFFSCTRLFLLKKKNEEIKKNHVNTRCKYTHPKLSLSFSEREITINHLISRSAHSHTTIYILNKMKKNKRKKINKEMKKKAHDVILFSSCVYRSFFKKI